MNFPLLLNSLFVWVDPNLACGVFSRAVGKLTGSGSLQLGQLDPREVEGVCLRAPFTADLSDRIDGVESPPLGFPANSTDGHVVRPLRGYLCASDMGARKS